MSVYKPLYKENPNIPKREITLTFGDKLSMLAERQRSKLVKRARKEEARKTKKLDRLYKKVKRHLKREAKKGCKFAAYRVDEFPSIYEDIDAAEVIGVRLKKECPNNRVWASDLNKIVIQFIEE